jgi:hypothetical protein
MKKEQVFEKVRGGFLLLFRVLLPRLDSLRIFGENRLVAASCES